VRVALPDAKFLAVLGGEHVLVALLWTQSVGQDKVRFSLLEGNDALWIADRDLLKVNIHSLVELSLVNAGVSAILVCCERHHDPHECPAYERCPRRPRASPPDQR
jgi:hypothetical protein